MEQKTFTSTSQALLTQYTTIRRYTESLCEPLEVEDYVVQPVAHVSPPKWHLGHTTWFFETFILKPYAAGYSVFNNQYNYVFNSYYETVGARVVRTDRGNLSRPSVADVYHYRTYVDEQMEAFLNQGVLTEAVAELLVLGLHHEQQHQELLLTDIKYILGHNPLFPRYTDELKPEKIPMEELVMLQIPEGQYEIGFRGSGFCYDNELGRHTTYLQEFAIANRLVTNGEYLDFIEDGGYRDFRYWHSEGWDWVKTQQAEAPLYWYLIDGQHMYYTLRGLQQIDLAAPVCHVNFYEASAYAAWKGMRLPTEAEWEVASSRFEWGERWEWTGSAYLPYPGFKKAAGAVGEYNGKFMVNQMVLRGASVGTSPGHSRPTYRNFFHAEHQWQFTGIRLCASYS
ncbi:ergothioneine biosynthesis protein EgtB [Sphingobacterium chuzhouense]|uniref:Ergothioneine biosynthesis protein EgtB n=1 Tax=Sphingobacterium chuzhouense TaxID=1742264 RepID=A0ABR7XXM6_9SPHI|nr:ergothioneine biosynthesis protein EgtB [Sphingobacterium chuzhouense]MBD1423814.1 ergothioneine biosynthesis protein EgtB [Sphingobacterium chuzhouense]